MRSTCSSADAAIVTGVDLDHMDYLGDTREQIGFEKAGIYRAKRPPICADPQPPVSLLEHAGRKIGANLLSRRAGIPCHRGANGPVELSRRGLTSWSPACPCRRWRGRIPAAQCGGALAVLEAVQDRLPVSEGAIRQGLLDARVAGRFQRIRRQSATHAGCGAQPASCTRARRKLAAARIQFLAAPWRWSACWPTRMRRRCSPRWPPRRCVVDLPPRFAARTGCRGACGDGARARAGRARHGSIRTARSLSGSAKRSAGW
jgi:hypothetical protein